MSHHSAFVYNNKMYCYGGLLGSQSSQTNEGFYILDLATNKWSQKDISHFEKKKVVKADPMNPKNKFEVEEMVRTSCEPRDDHCSIFDEKTSNFYVFGGYVNGDKSNDLWSYNLTSEKWSCLHEGDYKKEAHR